MTKKVVASRQNISASASSSVALSEKDKKWVSSKPFAIASIILAMLIAVIVSFIPQLSGSFLIGVVIAILLAFSIIQRPELGAYILIITVFTNLSDYLTIQGLPSVNKPLTALIYVSILANYILRTGNLSKIPRLSRVEWSLLAYYLVVIISSFRTVGDGNAFDVILDITKDILVGVSMFFALNTKEKWNKGGIVLLAVVTIIAFLGIVKMITGMEGTFGGVAQLSGLGQKVADTKELRYGGPVGTPNFWGQALIAVFPLAIYRFAREKNIFLKIILLVSTFFILFAAFYTGSRGAIVALFIIVPLMAFERRVRVPTMIFSLVGFIFLLMVLPSNYTERFETLDILVQKDEYSLAQDDSFEGRQSAMLTGLAMFRANPFFGVGLGNYGINYWDYSAKLGLDSSVTNIDLTDLPSPHSLYVEVISETGLFGILTFLSFVGTLLAGLLRTYKKLVKANADPSWANWIIGFFFAILSFLISGIFLHGILWRYIWILTGMAMSALAISENRSEALHNLAKQSA